MTREEAIEVLEKMKYPQKVNKNGFIISNVNIENEALEMAIKALEQEPCTDAVSREAVIKAITNTSGIRGDALNALYALPSVNPQPCDDAISREETIKAIKESAESPAFKGFMAMEQYLPEDAIEAIQKLPSVTQKSGKWIPVSERLPEENTAVLIWCPERKNIYCGYLEEKRWWIFGAYFQKVPLEVIAWRPLPKPYEPQESEA